jgi:toxin CcdB
MAPFDVHENQNQETNQAIPYLLDVQAELLENLATRVDVPLITSSAMGKAVKHLNPQLEIRRAPVFMSTAELAGVPVRILGEKVGSLKDRRNDIIAAIDFLFTGF